jgi:hypothetical protein
MVWIVPQIELVPKFRENLGTRVLVAIALIAVPLPAAPMEIVTDNAPLLYDWF